MHDAPTFYNFYLIYVNNSDELSCSSACFGKVYVLLIPSKIEFLLVDMVRVLVVFEL